MLYYCIDAEFFRSARREMPISILSTSPASAAEEYTMLINGWRPDALRRRVVVTDARTLESVMYPVHLSRPWSKRR